MARALAPATMPPLGRATEWRRSNRRGSMYHAHVGLGRVLCDALVLDRHRSRATDNLGDLQFWGVCPRCARKAETEGNPS